MKIKSHRRCVSWVQLAAGLTSWIGSLPVQGQPEPDEGPLPDRPAALVAPAERTDPVAMQEQADFALTTIAAARDQLQNKLADARRGADVIKTLCLDDKVRQIGNALAAAKAHRTSLADAVGVGATERAQYELGLLQAILERVQQLASDSERCVGEEATLDDSRQDDTDLDLEIEKILPGIDSDLIELAPLIAAAPSISSAFD